MKLIVPINVEELTRNEFSPKTMSTIVQLVQRGYRLAKEAPKFVPFLNWEIGEDHEGYLRPIAINYLFKQEIVNNRLPFSVTTEFNRNKSHRFLVYSNGPVKMTISQVPSSKSIARPAYFRSKLQEANQVRMSFDGEETFIENNKEYYLLLTYSSGGKEPHFVNLGMPNGQYWEDKINLLKEPHVVSVQREELDKEEVITEETIIGLKKYADEVEGSGS